HADPALHVHTSTYCADGTHLNCYAAKRQTESTQCEIENFGSMDILCSDKTGTLTSGDMVLDRHLDPLGQVSERPFALAYINSSYQTGIKSPLDEAILKRGGIAINEYRKIDEIPFDFE